MSKLTGFYPGSFDPVTNGHLDVIEKACTIVDVLFIGIGVNSKKEPLLSDELRLSLLKETCAPIAARTDTEVHFVDFDELMVDAARKVGATIVIRGLRDTTDYNYEMQMVGMNSQMAPDLQTVFVPATPNVRHISATLVREVAKMGGDVSAFVPAVVLKALKK